MFYSYTFLRDFIIIQVLFNVPNVLHMNQWYIKVFSNVS